MPELPEVETVVRGLRPKLEGRVLAEVEQRCASLRFPLPADFAGRLRGRRVLSIGRRAKYILVHLDGGEVLLRAIKDAEGLGKVLCGRARLEHAEGHAQAARAALTERRRLLIRYVRKDGEESERVVRPLGAFFWGKVWTLAAWCELREDFRTFRLDRMETIEAGEPFEEQPGLTLRDYLRNIGPYAERLLD